MNGAKKKLILYLRTLLLLTLSLSVVISCSSRTELTWKQKKGYRWAQLSPGSWGDVGFEEMEASHTGVNFKNYLAKESIINNSNLLNGSGVATADINGDGRVDLYFAQLDGPNKLYKNLGGFRFKDITDSSGVAHKDYYSTGVVFSDVDGDKDQDLLITSLTKKNSLYINNGKGQFKLKENSGLGASSGSTTMTLADIDQDEDLDLYVANYKEKSVKDLYGLMDITWENTVKREQNEYRLIPPFDEHFTLIPSGNVPERRELGIKDELYINKGDGQFKKASNPEQLFLDQNGNKKGFEQDWGLTAKFQDINNDMLPDLYICNDFWTPDRVWINQGKGTFKAIDKLAIRHFSFSSMAIDFSDINRDGSVDFFVTEMLSSNHERRLRQASTYSPFTDSIGSIDNQPQYMRNTFYLNRGDTSFAETAYLSGLEASGWSWATRFLDVDLDGYEDLFINTGNAYDVQDLDAQEKLSQMIRQSQQNMEGYILEYPPLKLTNKIFRNKGDLTFSDRSADWGFTEEDISHGMATADFDNDGDLDMVINRLNQEAAVFKNTSNAARIAVRLKGDKPNSNAIGAKIKVTGGPVIQEKEVEVGGEYLSGSDPLTVFAADDENNSHSITVRWPDGSRSMIDSVKANSILEIKQSTSGRTSIEDQTTKETETFFEDVSDRVNHSHVEKSYDDFGTQPLLPVRLSQLGPGISWIDFDRDNDDDLFIASGKEGKLGLYENNGANSFKKQSMGPLTDNAPGDQTTVLGWREKDEVKILVGISDLERPSADATSVNIYTIIDGQIVKSEGLSDSFYSTGALAAADYDKDGDIDLFVGGRSIPRHYPTDASSRLFKNESDRFKPDKKNAALFEELGLLTSAVFTDYDQDGDQDLLCSREWDTIMLFENRAGVFHDITEKVGLDKFKGWWNGIATGDFNSDGLPDIIATNKGLNSSYQVSSKLYPLKLFYGDFDQDYQIEMIEAYHDSTISSYVPKRKLYVLYNSISSIVNNVNSHQEFASTPLDAMLGMDLSKVSSKEINTLQHMLFINEGDNFSPQALPKETQVTTAFSANVADFNNDGKEDLFLSQNFFAVPRLTSRQDAGRGLWLKGDGKGNLEPVRGQKSGVKVYGEQRGAALSDFNRDGKVDLAITQNGAQTKLYLNKNKKTGITIKLAGPSENRDGIGSSIRLVYDNGIKGPRREIQAGSGYWSQNSMTQIMGTEALPKSVEVIWSDGTKQTVSVTDGKQNFVIQYPK